MNTKLILNLLFTGVILLLMGCGAISYVPVSTGILAEENTKIVAVDGSFTIETDNRFSPPFQSEKAFFENGSQPIVSDVYKLTSGQYKGFKWKKVRVQTPHHSEDLYGVISFCKVQKDCQNEPVTRSYRLSVPEEYVDAALGGRVSCVYEYYSCNGMPKIATWVLWLSDVPF